MISKIAIKAACNGISKTDYIPHYSMHLWGGDIKIMHQFGSAFARIYWYDDDETTVYLDMLSVSPYLRRKGIGTELQKIREEIGRHFKATTSCLWVEKGSWMHEWYKRRGYVDFADHKTDENAIWMKKSL